MANVSGEVGLAVKIAALGLGVSSTPPQGSEVMGGDRITYTLRVSNTGGIDLSGIWLRTEVPTNTEYIVGSAQPPAEDQRRPTAELVWRLPGLAQNAQFVAQFGVQVKPLTKAAALWSIGRKWRAIRHRSRGGQW